MSSAYDASSEIFSLYSHPLTRASSTTQDSEPLPTPPDETFLNRGRKPGYQVNKTSALDDAVRVRSATPETPQYLSRERRLGALPEALEGEVEPYGPYFSLPRDPTASATPLVRRRTTKELIGRFESMSQRSEARGAGLTGRRNEEQPSARRPGAYPAVEKKGRSPIRQSIRNILSVFKKKSYGREPVEALVVPDGQSRIDGVAGGLRPLPRMQSAAAPSEPQALPKLSKDLSICSTPLEVIQSRRSGPLLYLSRVSSAAVHPVWTDCIATLHSTHVVLTSRTPHGNPSSDIIPFKACTDVRSLAMMELGADERSLLPSGAGDVKVFELLFEGRPREKFAARSVTERATWVSAIWDAILHAQEQRSEAASYIAREAQATLQSVAGTEQGSLLEARTEHKGSPHTDRSQLSQPNLDRALPEIPRTMTAPSSAPRLTLQIPTSASPARSSPSPLSGLSPLPRPPTTPIRQSTFISPVTPTRSQSPSIRNLDQRSMVKQRLAQLENVNSPSSPTRSSGSGNALCSPTGDMGSAVRNPDDGLVQQHAGPVSAAGESIINSYGSSSAMSPLSAYSGRLTSVPGTPSPFRTAARWESPAEAKAPLLRPPPRDLIAVSPASRYSTDELLDGPRSTVGLTKPLSDISQPQPAAAPPIASRRPIIRLDTSVSSLKPPVILRDQTRTASQSRVEQLTNKQNERRPHPDVLPPVAELDEDSRFPRMTAIQGDQGRPPSPDSASTHLQQALPPSHLQRMLEGIGNSVMKLEGRSDAGVSSMADIRSKLNTILLQLRNAPGSSDGQNVGDMSQVLQKFEEMLTELKDAKATPAGEIPASGDHVDVHAKLDRLVSLYQEAGRGGVGEGHVKEVDEERSQQIEEILALLRNGQSQWASQAEQQTDSIRYLNELNSWLEAFVNHGTSQIESVATGVQQLCKDLGPVPELHAQGGDGQHPGGGSLLADIRRLLVDNQGREDHAVALHASVNALVAVVQDDLKKNAEARNGLTTESLVGLIDRQRQDHERMLRSLGTELSNEIRGERLRFVEAMKEATAINVQIHVEEFKKELTREVLLMTQEVCRLQEERQGLEQQIADLFAFYAKQKQAGGLLQTTRQNMQQAPGRSQPSQPVPGGYPAPSRRRPLPSPGVAPRPASSFA